MTAIACLRLAPHWIVAGLLLFSWPIGSAFGQAAGQGGAPRAIPFDKTEARKADPFARLHDRPMADNPLIIPQLRADADKLPPAYLYELARRLWPTDQAGAMEWYAVAMMRARYDAMKCADATARQGISFLPMIAPEIGLGIENNRKAFGEAGLRALARADLLTDSVDPIWICSHGMKMIDSAINGRGQSPAEWLRPQSDWAAIRADIRKSHQEFFVQQGVAQDDPIPLSKTQFPRWGGAAPHKGPFAWLDDDTLVTSFRETGPDGKAVQRIVRIAPDGSQSDVGTTTGFWCAGNGQVSRQIAEEPIGEGVRRVTLSRGSLDAPVSETLEMRKPYLESFGAQSFAIDWSLPANPVRQSPFDCRWERNERLSGERNANSWMPLLPEDGAIQFPGPAVQGLQWVSADGKVTRIPVDAQQIAMSSIRHVKWMDAYFVAPTWSRFKHKSPDMPRCVEAAFIRPRLGQVESVCVPFDEKNTANAVMVSPSRLGWLRLTSYRNTPHGQKTGGLYVTRDDGKTEKLVDAHIDGWNLSPDGCKVAFSHRPKESGQSILDVIDLCKGQ